MQKKLSCFVAVAFFYTENEPNIFLFECCKNNNLSLTLAQPELIKDNYFM